MLTMKKQIAMVNFLSRIKFEHIVIAGLLIYLFIPKGRKQVQDNTGQIKALQQVIEEKQKHLETFRDWKDAEIANYLRRDSMLTASFNNNQKTYKPIYENLKNIGSRVDAISDNDAELRAAYRKRFD